MPSDHSAGLGDDPLPYAWELAVLSFGAFIGGLSLELAILVIGVFGGGQVVASFAFAKKARTEGAKDA